MENGLTDHTQFIEYKVGQVMWKVLPPFILVLGTFGNLSTILVMNRIKDNNSSQYAILMALAMADLCLLYTGLLKGWVLFAFYVNWTELNTLICKLQIWAVYASNTTSAWLVTTVTMQRTMAVLWPHRMRMMCTVRKTWVVVAVVVVIACSLHFHLIIGFHIIEENVCTISGMYYQFFYFVWTWVDMCLSSLIPFTCLIVCSSILSWILFQSSSLSSTAVHATSNVHTGPSRSSRKSDAVKVTVMILALSYTFLILTLPVCISLIVDEEYNFPPKITALLSFFNVLTRMMWYSNSAVNFLLYCITGTRFRNEFWGLFRCSAKGHTIGDAAANIPSGGGSTNS